MFNHAPADYTCPFCEFIAGRETPYKQLDDIVYQNDSVLAFISPKWWVNNPGHVIVITKKHFENIYDIPDEDFAEVNKAAKKIAIAIRETYGCDGISTRQHNEPDGGQDVWHFHMHVFPRHKDDHLYENHENKTFVDPEARAPYARKLREYFGK
jgi:histidine triad (HIT) family protein